MRLPRAGRNRYGSWWHGWIHWLLDICIIVFSSFLLHQYRKGGHRYIKGLRDAYLYDLIMAIWALVGSLLLGLDIIVGHPIILATASLLPIMYLFGFVWTEYQDQHHVHKLRLQPLSTTLVVFLGIGAFLSIGGLVIEIWWYRLRATASRATPVTPA